jgi:hypothetical protein
MPFISKLVKERRKYKTFYDYFANNKNQRLTGVSNEQINTANIPAI